MDLEASARRARYGASFPPTALSPVTHKSQPRKLHRDPRVTLVYRKLKSVTAAFGEPRLSLPLNYVLGEHGGVLLILSLHGNSCEGKLAFCCLDLREGKQCGGCHKAMEMSASWWAGVNYKTFYESELAQFATTINGKS